jgi:hypothetical protein
MTSFRGHGSLVAKLVPSAWNKTKRAAMRRDHRVILSSHRVGKSARRDKLFALILPIISSLP